MGVINKCKYQSSPKQLNTLSSCECLAHSEIQLFSWLCCPKKEDCNCIWEDAKYKLQRVKKKPKGCKKMKWSKRLQCKKERAVLEIYRFLKIIKENIALIIRCGLTENNINCKYTSIEPTFVLAHLSAKMLQFEKQFKHLPCFKNDNCRLAILMKIVKRNILLQFICGPQANEALLSTIRDVANIDCLLKSIEDRCMCSTTSTEDEEEPYKPSFVETSDKSVNTDGIDIIAVPLKKEDKATSYDITEQKNYSLDDHPLSNKHWLYTYRQKNSTKATEFGNHKKNLMYYYDVRQINRMTSTSDIPFEGDIAYLSDLVDKRSQTDPCFRFNESYEVTATCVSYKNERNVKELDELPKLNNVTNDYIETNIYGDNLYVKKENGEKHYMTRIQGINIVAETKTNDNIEELTVIYNNETSATYTTTGNSPQADSNIIALKQEIFNQAKKAATQIVTNFYREKNKKGNSSWNTQKSGFIENNNIAISRSDDYGKVDLLGRNTRIMV